MVRSRPPDSSPSRRSTSASRSTFPTNVRFAGSRNASCRKNRSKASSKRSLLLAGLGERQAQGVAQQPPWFSMPTRETTSKATRVSAGDTRTSAFRSACTNREKVTSMKRRSISPGLLRFADRPMHTVFTSVGALLPHWHLDRIERIAYLPGGYANDNYRFEYEGAAYAVRIVRRSGPARHAEARFLALPDRTGRGRLRSLRRRPGHALDRRDPARGVRRGPGARRRLSARTPRPDSCRRGALRSTPGDPPGTSTQPARSRRHRQPHWSWAGRPRRSAAATTTSTPGTSCRRAPPGAPSTGSSRATTTRCSISSCLGHGLGYDDTEMDVLAAAYLDVQDVAARRLLDTPHRLRAARVRVGPGDSSRSAVNARKSGPRPWPPRSP